MPGKLVYLILMNLSKWRTMSCMLVQGQWRTLFTVWPVVPKTEILTPPVAELSLPELSLP